ncbi:MAG: hypothetical protein ACRECX_13790 [Methyloceanibacter sp.]|uniref:hypothetical protein n=1 Tax=Methyloceanibacter sp. TaxID=1965321 RepID=UPI003D6CAF9C
MHKFLTTTAVALFLAAGPALAAEDYDAPDESGAVPEASQSDESSVLPSDPELKPEDESAPEEPLAAAEDAGSADIPADEAEEPAAGEQPEEESESSQE